MSSVRSRSAVEVEEIYPELAGRLTALVARNVTAPDAVIEEACQVAWGRLHQHREDVQPGSVLGWLCTTATREALRIVRTRVRCVSLDELQEGAEVIELPTRAPGPEQVVAMRERLAEVRALPLRQRRMLWLQGIGYDYREIAHLTGDSQRTVERQLFKARRRLALAGEEEEVG